MKIKNIIGILLIFCLSFSVEASIIEQNTGSENFNATAGIFYDKTGYDYILYHPHKLLNEGIILNYNLKGLAEMGFSFLSPPDITQNKITTSSRFIIAKENMPIKIGISYYLDKTTEPYSYYSPTMWWFNFEDYGAYSKEETFADGSKESDTRSYDGTEINLLSVLAGGIGIPLGKIKFGISYQNRIEYFYQGDSQYEYKYEQIETQVSSSGAVGYIDTTSIEYKNQPRDLEHLFIGSIGLPAGKNFNINVKFLMSFYSLKKNETLDYIKTEDNSPGSSVWNKDITTGLGSAIREPVNFGYDSHPYFNSIIDPERVSIDEPLNKYGGTLGTEFKLMQGMILDISGGFFTGSGTIDNTYQDYYKIIEYRPNTALTITEERTTETLLSYMEKGDNNYTSYGSRLKLTYQMASIAKIGFALDWGQSKQEKVLDTQANYTNKVQIDDKVSGNYTSDNWGTEQTTTTTENLEVKITDTEYTRVITIPIGMEIHVVEELSLLLGAKKIITYSATRIKFETTSDADVKESIDYADPSQTDKPPTTISDSTDIKYNNDIYTSTGKSESNSYFIGFQVYPSENSRLDFIWNVTSDYSLTWSYKF